MSTSANITAYVDRQKLDLRTVRLLTEHGHLHSDFLTAVTSLEEKYGLTSLDEGSSVAAGSEEWERPVLPTEVPVNQLGPFRLPDVYMYRFGCKPV